MTTPRSFKVSEPLEARLVTKTSLPEPKRAIALLVALWFAQDKPDTVEYGQVQNTQKNENILDEATVETIQQYADTNGISVDYVQLEHELAQNPLVNSQMEALNSAFELVWHLASFEFVDQKLNRGAERTGGVRYRKRIHYSINLDIIDTIGEANPAGLAGVLVDWMLSGKTSDAEMERRLTRALAVFAEPSLFKTSKGDTGKIFTQSGIYDALLDDDIFIDIVDPGEEPQGTTRILRPALAAGLNPMLATDNNKVVKADGIDDETLRNYSNRAKIGMDLSNIKVKISDNTKAEESKDAQSTSIDRPRNLIYFGAPGTGKSFQLNKEAIRTEKNPYGYFSEKNVRRVTFYPDYTYSQFVGSFRPFSNKGIIEYKYIAGPFLQTYLDASMRPHENYLLIIEELNRANAAAVFGDVFQLLDRNPDGVSDYSVAVPLDMAQCIEKVLDDVDEDTKAKIESYYDPDLDYSDFCESMLCSLSLPPNMYIWATMNSADQGVFPMDTAFKRRWDYQYIGIDDGESVIEDKEVEIVSEKGMRTLRWNDLRHSINKLLLDHASVNEDKLLGPFFVKPESLESTGSFVSAFKDKVLLYLYEDAGKMKRANLFKDGRWTYSQVCEAFEKQGTGVFADGFEDVPDYGSIISQENDASDDINVEA